MTLRRWLVIASAVALASCEPVQSANLILPSSAAANKQAVKDLFNVSYTAYRTYAFGHDDLLPQSKTYGDYLNGWGASISDALGTMWLMGFTDWFKDAVNHVATVDFSVSQSNANAVSLFETTIRHVGGLLSAYELSGQTNDTQVLVQKAEQVAKQLAYAFSAKTPIPYSNVDFTRHAALSGATSIATAGTLTLEWSRLSLHTGNDTYRQLAEKSVQYIIQNQNVMVLPGMPADLIDPSTGNPASSHVSWGSASDSFYEYLIKYPRLTNTNDSSYTDAWLAAVDTSIRTLMKTSTVGNRVYLAEYDQQVLHVGSHLACFYGGNWILGGKLTNNDTIFNIGLQLTDACWNTYASTATGIGPENFAFISNDGSYTGGSAPTPDQILFYNNHGYYITGSQYILRPEVLESNFYAWRATGNTKYLDNAAKAIKNFQKFLPGMVAYAGIQDVNNANSAKINDMPSFWFGEVLKYLYLTFDDPSTISLDDYVFNTECHPFKAPTAKPIYGSTV